MDNRIIINIGRQFGSGGRIVAQKIGEKLGIIMVVDYKPYKRCSISSSETVYFSGTTPGAAESPNAWVIA